MCLFNCLFNIFFFDTIFWYWYYFIVVVSVILTRINTQRYILTSNIKEYGSCVCLTAYSIFCFLIQYYFRPSLWSSCTQLRVRLMRCHLATRFHLTLRVRGVWSMRTDVWRCMVTPWRRSTCWSCPWSRQSESVHDTEVYLKAGRRQKVPFIARILPTVLECLYMYI